MFILYLFQRQLIYFPVNIKVTPEEYGVPEMVIVELKTDDNLRLMAWYRAAEQGRPTIVYFHGNAGHIGTRAPIVKPFLNEGYGVLLVSYRGYSGNPGTPSEEGFYKDGRAALNFLRNKRCIVLYGNSIGAAVAVQMATEFKVQTVILQSPFTTLADVARHHYPLFTFEILIKDQYRSIDIVDKLLPPTLVIYGEEDEINPPDLSRRLYKKLPDPKKILAVPHKGHNDLFVPEEIMYYIKEYIKCP
ncbi:MAG: alpha/beta hydrolase [Waddliaceae bacterium]